MVLGREDLFVGLELLLGRVKVGKPNVMIHTKEKAMDRYWCGAHDLCHVLDRLVYGWIPDSLPDHHREMHYCRL